MTEILRKPAVFSVDDPRLVVTLPKEQPFESETATDLAEAAPPASAKRRRVPWGALFWSALSGLVLMGLGLAVTKLVEDLFSRAPWLGTVGLVLASVAGLALLAVILREIVGLVRLAAVESLRRRALEVIETDDREAGKALTTALLAHTRRIPRLARARARLDDHRGDIIDGRDLVHLAERELMAPLDLEARRLVAASAKRVSVVTAISPRAAVDMVFVLINALNLMRRLAALYGGRPGALGMFKLFRQVMSHLAITGGVSVTDSLIQQIVGHGIAARLSARLGEGVVNGLLTARLGLLAMDVVRPLPFGTLPRPTLNELAGSLLRAPDFGAESSEKSRP
jgi:putative membrane protein